MKVKVVAPPEQGRANVAVCEMFAQWLGIGLRKVVLVAGALSPLKFVGVEGLCGAAAVERFTGAPPWWVCQRPDAPRAGSGGLQSGRASHEHPIINRYGKLRNSSLTA